MPVALVSALVAVVWPYLGHGRFVALLVAVGATVAGLVVALALDASIRIALAALGVGALVMMTRAYRPRPRSRPPRLA
jgi:hypothetical protein